MVSDGQGFIDNQDVRIDIDSDSESESRLHSARILFNWLIDKVTDIREIDDSRHPAFDFRVIHPEHQTFQTDVFASRQHIL